MQHPIELDENIQLQPGVLRKYQDQVDGVNRTGIFDNENDFDFYKNETFEFDGQQLNLLCGHINQREFDDDNDDEDDYYDDSEARRVKATKQEEDVCVLWNHVPEQITLSRSESSISYKFVMVVDKAEADVRQEMMNGKCEVYMIFSFHAQITVLFTGSAQIAITSERKTT